MARLSLISPFNFVYVPALLFLAVRAPQVSTIVTESHAHPAGGGGVVGGGRAGGDVGGLGSGEPQSQIHGLLLLQAAPVEAVLYLNVVPPESAQQCCGRLGLLCVPPLGTCTRGSQSAQSVPKSQ